MTDDLIGRAEAQTAIQFAAKRYMVAHEAHGEGQVVWSDNLINVTDAMNVLRDLPSAQPERKTGHWVKSDMQRWYDVWLCSECGEKTDSAVMSKPRYKYCPMCGAKMEERREDG
jgi:rubrerythrin